MPTLHTPSRWSSPSLLALLLATACGGSADARREFGAAQGGDAGRAGGGVTPAAGASGRGGSSGAAGAPLGGSSGNAGTGCSPNERGCVGDEVRVCAADGSRFGALVETCNVSAGLRCSDGACLTACALAEQSPSNVGCEFWAVDLDQQDDGNDPASAPWGVGLANPGQVQAAVTIEYNAAAVGQPRQLRVATQVSVPPGGMRQVVLPTRELDCGTQPNDYASPGTCLSSNAYRITSSSPLTAFQLNAMASAFSNDASLLLPTNALGRAYRALAWPPGHPVPIHLGGVDLPVDRSYLTVVGVAANTEVRVRPSWRIRGNSPIAQTDKGGTILVTLNPFDVLNLETDDMSFDENAQSLAGDLSGSIIAANHPIAVFSGAESTSAPRDLEVPTWQGWSASEGSTCCLDHLEDQLFPVESLGSHYVITRSPLRSKTSFQEPDVLRFLGVAESAVVTTNLPAPYDHFTLAPGEVKTTWTQLDVTVSATKPIAVAQLLVGQGYVQGAKLGDPSLLLFPSVEQYRTEYALLTPESWDQSYVVISAEVGTSVTLDGATPSDCITAQAGVLNGLSYEARRCAVADGPHHLSSTKPFGVAVYGYSRAASYALAGGANVKPIYQAPDLF